MLKSEEKTQQKRREKGTGGITLRKDGTWQGKFDPAQEILSQCDSCKHKAFFCGFDDGCARYGSTTDCVNIRRPGVEQII